MKERGGTVFLVGLDATTASGLAAKYPGLTIRHLAAPMDLDRNAASFQATIAAIRAQKADLLLLAIGSPRQERLAHALQVAGGGTGLALCVGAAPAFAAGTQRRAPPARRRAGLEWGWRLVREPHRLARRYLIDGPPPYSRSHVPRGGHGLVRPPDQRDKSSWMPVSRPARRADMRPLVSAISTRWEECRAPIDPPQP